MKSPLSILGNGECDTDSNVFKTVALYMENGLMPYKDTFDHKGPIIYIINFFGNIISYLRGVWYVEWFFLTITFGAIYKTARIFCDEFCAFATVLLSTAPLFRYYYGGNFTEEYAMAYIAVALFIFMDYLKNDIITRIRLIVCGICFGSVLMLRVNLISVWIVFSCAVLFSSLKEKKYSCLKYYLVWFLCGMSIVLVPIIIWLVKNRALMDFWNCYIKFNMQYSSAMSDMTMIEKLWNGFFYFSKPPIVILSMFITVYLILFRRKLIDIAYGCYFLLEFIMLSMSGMTYDHYGMVLIPLIATPLAIGMGNINENDKNRMPFAAICLIVFITVPNWMDLVENIPDQYGQDYESENLSSAQEISNIILAYGEPDDTLSVYGNWDSIHVKTRLLSTSKYTYQFPIGVVNTKILDNYFENIEENQPDWLVVEAGRMDEKIAEYIRRYHYMEYGNFENHVVYHIQR